MAADPAPRLWRRLTSGSPVPSPSKAPAAARSEGSAAPLVAPAKLNLRVDVGGLGEAAATDLDSQPGSAIRAYVPPSLLPSPAAAAAAAEHRADGLHLHPGSGCLAPSGRSWTSPPAKGSSPPPRSSINSPPRLAHLQPRRPPPPPPLRASLASPGSSTRVAAAQRSPQQLFMLPPEQEPAHRYERLS
ncbi:hypothetical protein ABPG75_005357 [Micractinium tetrahymenae]